MRYFTIIMLLLMIPVCLAVQPTQQFNKLLLEPFYVASMTQNTNYSYNVMITAPDGITSVKTAILTLDAWINPTRTFNAWINNVQCNTKNYVVSTSYSGAGRAVVTFDCTNAVLPNRNNEIKITVSGGNIGSSTAWLDLTYMNNPMGTTILHGTEYITGQNAKLWLQLLNSSNQAIESGVCYIDIYNPANEEYIEGSLMTNMEHDGIYYYDIVAPDIPGVYPAIAKCFYNAEQTIVLASSYAILNGKYSSGTLSSTYILDGNYLKIDTDKNGGLTVNNTLNVTFNFTGFFGNCSSVSEELLSSVSIYFNGKWSGTAPNDVYLLIYNYSSASWIQMPNIIEGGLGAAAQTITETIETNNITKALGINASNPFIMRFKNTNYNEGAKELAFDYVYASCEALSDQNYHEVKGSSEMHVSSEFDYDFYSETLCGSNMKSSCAIFVNHTFQPEGVLLDNITISNPTDGELESEVYYSTPNGIDCTAIVNITQTNGVTIDITDNSTYSLGTFDNCNIVIPVELASNISTTVIEIVMDNYLLWEIYRAKDFREVYRIFQNECIDYGTSENYTYQIPVTDQYRYLSSSDPQLVFCNRVLDDFYYFDTFYNDSLAINVIGEFESYYYEVVEYYLPKIMTSYEAYHTFLAYNDIQVLLNNTNTTIITSSIWNHSTRNLTYYPNVTVNMTEISLNVWNSTDRNLTYYPDTVNYSNITVGIWNYTGNISPSLITQFTYDVWNYVGRYVHGIIYS